MRKNSASISAATLIVAFQLVACAGGSGSLNSSIPDSLSVTGNTTPMTGGSGSGNDNGTANAGANPGAAGPVTSQLAIYGGPVFRDTESQSVDYPLSGVAFPLQVSVLQPTANGLAVVSGNQNASATLTKSSQSWTLAHVPGTHVELSVPAAGVSVSLDTPDLLGGLEDYWTFGLSYVVLGNWSDSYSPVGLNGKAMAFAFGYETPATSMPTTGQAAFSGQVQGVVFNQGAAISQDRVGGIATFAADFASGSITGGFTKMHSGSTPWNDVSVNASIAAGTNKFTGTTAVTSVPEGMFSLNSSATGSINGAFYGPAAENLGAVWTLSDGKDSAMGRFRATAEIALGVRTLRAALRRKCFAFAAIFCAFAPAFAQEPSAPVQPQQISFTAAAALLLQANRIDDAERVLTLALQQNPNDNEAIFLRGMIAVARKNYDTAVEDFRRILAVEPERERVRLELARSFFLQGDFENAERNFRFARAGDLPDEAKANVDQYLAAIIRLKRWSYDLSLGVADDTNVNGATNLRTVYLYGLPFTLSDNARQTSGIGAAIDLSGEFSPLLSDDTKFLAGGLVHRLQYGRGRFDDMTVSLYAGPQFFFGRWRVDTLATGFGRWYGEAPYSAGVGGRTSVGYALLPTLQLGLTLDGQSVSYRPIHDQNGPIYWVNGEIAYTLSPSRILRFSGGMAAQQARLNVYASTIYWTAIDFYQDLPYGFSTNLEPAYSTTAYGAPLAAFDASRSDYTWAFRVDLLNRRLEYRGFAPRVSLIYVTQQSSISLYSFSRTQVQFGVTRQF